MSTIPRKTFIQTLQRISSFFRENTLGVFVLSITASVIATFIAAYLVSNGNQLWSEVKNLFPFTIVLCCVCGFWLWDNRNSRGKLREALLALENMSEARTFDDVVLFFLAQLVSVRPDERKEKLKEILRKLLQNAVRAKVGDNGVFNAAIFLPTERKLHQLFLDARGAGRNAPTSQLALEPLSEEDQYMTIWALTGLDKDIEKHVRCYIGDKKPIKRGFPGVAFEATTPLVAHMIKKGGKWICDEYPDDYFQFDTYDDPRYRALAAAPIVTLWKTNKTTLGVVYFESMNPRVFDSKEARIALNTVSTRIGAIISIYWQMISSASGTSPNH
jgi:hypothetical protein